MSLFAHKHKYEPRYDEKPYGTLAGAKVTNVDASELRSLVFYKVYVCDVCAGCGNVINRSNDEASK